MVGAEPEFEEFGREVGTGELGDGDGEEDVWAGGVWDVKHVTGEVSEMEGVAGSMAEGGEQKGGNFGWSGVCVEMEGQRCKG